MKLMKSTKWYLWALLLDVYAGLRFLDTLKLLPETFLSAPRTKVIFGVFLLVLFIVLCLAEKAAGRNVTEYFKAHGLLKILCVAGLLLILIDFFARDILAVG